ncbi:MAG: acetolactate synthase large subunit, partial [Caulobacteraceae bacterium]|nr:acetolactate synthase large subunit [Caulobacter sp.]
GGAIARSLPEDAVVSDDAVTAGLPIYTQTAGAARHDWLFLTGGAIGQGLPVAVGAAVARPGAKVVSINGDGAAAYTLQALWTMVREGLDVTVVVVANRRYRILDIELQRTGAGRAGPAARGLLDLGDPAMDWRALAAGFGMAADRCDTAEAFDAAFARAMAEPGPRLIEAMVR